MAFDIHSLEGHKVRIDTDPDVGGENSGSNPIETFVGAAAACTAMDVLSILRKMRQEPESYEIEVHWERTEPGVYPRPVKEIHFVHKVTGDVKQESLEKAVSLSEEKYCGVLSTIKSTPQITSSVEISD